MHGIVGLALALAIVGDGKDGNSLAKVPDGYRIVEDSLRFARNGSKVAYVVAKGSKQRPVVGTTLGEEYDAVMPPVITATGDHVAFRAMSLDRNKRPHWTLVYDGKPYASDDWIGQVALAPKDGTPAFWLSHGWINNSDGHLSHGPMALQFGKSKGTKWQGTNEEMPPNFSADGKFAVSVGTKGGDTSILSLDAKGKETKHGSDVTFAVEAVVSPDGSEIAYSSPNHASGDPKYTHHYDFVVHTEGFDGPHSGDLIAPASQAYASAGSPVYSRDSKHIAYRIEENDRFGVALDNSKDAKCEFDFVDEISVSPDQAKLAYLACNGCKLDQKAGFEVLGGTNAKGGKWIVVHGPERSREYDAARSPTWSRDGKQLAYVARVAQKWHVFVGAKSSDPCDEISNLTWADDGRSIGYGCLQGEELIWRTFGLE